MELKNSLEDKTPALASPGNLSRIIIGISIVLATATVIGVFVFGGLGFGETNQLAQVVWILPTAQSLMFLAAIALAVLFLGRYLTLGKAWVYWSGTLFLANGTLGIFYMLAWPGLRGDQGLIAVLPNTSAWLAELLFSIVALQIVAAVAHRRVHLKPTRIFAGCGLAITLPILAGLLSVLFENHLPTLIRGTSFMPLLKIWSTIIIVVALIGAALAYRRFKAGEDTMLGYLALFLMLFAFGIIHPLIGGKRYDYWWYFSRIELVASYLILFFGLLQEGYTLFGSERRLAEEKRRHLDEVQQEKDRLSALINSMTDEVWFADAEKNVALINQAVLNEFGAFDSADVASVASRFEAYRPDGTLRPPSEAPPLRALRGEVVKAQNEIVRTPATGELRHRQVNAAPVKDAGGNIIGSVSVVRDITELKRSEKALRESELKFRTVANNTYDWEFWTRPEGGFIYCSPSCKRLTGHSPEEFMKDPDLFRSIVHPEDLAVFDRHRHEEEEEEEEEEVTPQEIQFRIIHNDGSTRWIGHVCQRVFDEQGKFLGIRGSNRDITERKRAEAVLHESEERFRVIFEDNSDGMLVADPQSKAFVMGNPAICRMLGCRPEEIPTMWLADIHCPEDMALVLEHFESFVSGRQSPSKDIPVKRKDGSVFFADVTATSITLSGKTYLVGCFRDITERKQAAEALRQSEERFRLITSSTPDHLLVQDRGLRYTMVVNPQLGLTEKDMIGKTDFDILAKEEAEKLTPTKRKVIETGKPVYLESPAISRDGMTEFFEGSYVPKFDAQGQCDGLIGYFRNVTERKRAEEALQQRTLELQHLTETLEQRVKDRTEELANLSAQLVSAQENERKRVSYDLHDNVWQTLIAIRFEIEGLFSKLGKEDEVVLRKRSKEVMADILGAVGKIRSMQGDLWPYVLDDIGIIPTIDWYCREFEKSHSGLVLERKNDLAESEIPPSIKIVVYRIMQETLSNVAEHSHASRVTVRLMKNGQEMEFGVEDNGMGFDPEETLARKTPWGGLGLLSIKARTELSGGTFGIKSAKGKGTTIRASWRLD